MRSYLVRIGIVLALLFSYAPAEAYPSMLRHGYVGCATCHVDPSGSGLLTPYGRTIGELVLRTRYGESSDSPGPGAEFLFGALSLPPELMLGGDARLLWITHKVEGVPVTRKLFVMQLDFEAGFRAHGLLGSASLGYAEDGGFGAAITRGPEKNLISRHHWLGWEIDAEAGLLLRAGRLLPPFGIRMVEHTLWARVLTDSGINDDQQHGLALAFAPEPFRGEVMAVLGNYQLRPDEYRERGASSSLEWSPNSDLGLGVSHLVTHRDLDPGYLRETWRHQFGGFGRWATSFEPLVLLAEADYVFRSPKQDQRREGGVGFLQLDLEPFQGFHLLATGEVHNVGVNAPPVSWGLWLSEHWFFAPHADLRLDAIYQSLGSDLGRTDVLTLLVQGHLYL